MPQTPGVPDHAAIDARSRALRTFLQGLGVDVLLAVCLVVYTATTAESVAWGLLPLAILKSVLTAGASYVMRKLAPPQESLR